MANTTTSTGSIPSYIQDPTKKALGDIEGWLGSGSNYVYGSKPGESLYTPLAQNQQKAMGNISWLADQDLAELFGTNKASGLWDKYTGAGAQTLTGSYTNPQGQQITAGKNTQGQQISGGTNTAAGAISGGTNTAADAITGGTNTAGQAITGGGVAGQINTGAYGPGSNTVQGERLVDENGYLGAISDYMDPYLQEVLNPQMRELDESLQKGIRAQGANAQMSGAFGDARHGIVDRGLYEDRSQLGADITGKAHSDAFNTAMGLRSGDINREAQLQEAGLGRGLAADTTNLGFKENALNRDLQAQMAKAGFAESDLGRNMQAQLAKAGFQEADLTRAMQAATSKAQFMDSDLGRQMQAQLAKAGFAQADIDREMEAAMARANFAESDVNRRLGVDTLNQGAREADIARQGTGAQAASALGQQYFKNFTDVNDALFNAGEIERGADQEKSDAMRKFQEAMKNKKYDDALKLLGAVQGSPYPSSSTSETKSDDGLMGMLGSILGGVFG